ncbi:helix-turn-helix transcriptional regulator [Roseobacter sp. HKCCA0434]|uniref:helix-turn-helix domain-containing protein n=1 Tax=Roseobacter sp. HKCCA0434 TaxID=3079297 RepID=UPI002905AD30|nr:helix-turn-helix transcriptional regulator [Roseobacter sp. HKCCA0434]
MTEEQADGYYFDEIATFGDRLAAAREALGMTQNELARRLGVKPATIVNWEDDRAEPRANRLSMLAGILGVTLKWLISGQGEGPGVETEPLDADALALLAELRRIRTEQARLIDRMGVIEKRLRERLS